MDDIDVTSSMSAPARPDEVVQPYMLTVVEAADLLGIGKTMAYELVHLFVESGGAYGIPAVQHSSRLAGAATGVDGEDSYVPDRPAGRMGSGRTRAAPAPGHRCSS